MTWSNSKISSAFVADALNGTAPFDVNSDSLKAALFNNSITPDQAAAAASFAYNAGQWANSNELSQGGWAAGGIALTGVASGFASNVYTLDANDTANGSATTISGAFGCLVYDDTLTTPVADQGLSFHYFGGTQSVTAGTFTIVWAAAGVLSLTL